MSIQKFILVGTVVLFSGIGVLALWKKDKKGAEIKPHLQEMLSSSRAKNAKTIEKESKEKSSVARVSESLAVADADFPDIDRVFQLFTTGDAKLPIVETVSYSSSTSWLKGRPAWIADYAVYYNTSKHFIARSLNGSPDYFSQKVSTGSRFNVFRRDKKIEFHLVIDITRLKLAFYYLDLDSHERVLLKVYKVGLGRLDPTKPSGILTPLGTYQLGDKVSIYSPGVTGLFHEQKTEMIRVFGSRWIPFGEAIQGCTEPPRGYGLHGAPWAVDSVTGSLVENRDCIGKYESDGCVRLLLEDIEELYAIVVTKPTFVHIAKNFRDITLPGVEVGAPSR